MRRLYGTQPPHYGATIDLNTRSGLAPAGRKSVFGAKRTWTGGQNRLDRSKMTHFGPEQPRFAVMHKRATLFPLDDDLGYRHSRDDFAYVSLAGGVIHQQAHPGIDNTLVIRT
jgi:hypothetical protein